MSSKIPTFQKGDIICVIDFLDSTKDPDSWDEYESGKNTGEVMKFAEFSGIPCKVIFQENPFVLCQPVSAPHSITALDMRKHNVQIMSEKYYNIWKKVHERIWTSYERDQNQDVPKLEINSDSSN